MPVSKIPSRHGRRYTSAEMKEIRAYMKDHTWEETSRRFGVGENTLARWHFYK